MKKFLIFALCAGASFSAAATNDVAAKRFASRADEAAKKWCARTQRAFGWDGTKWVLDDTYRNTYTREGLISLQVKTDIEGSVVRLTNRWNSNGMLTARLKEEATSSAAPYHRTEQLSRTYDERVTSFITLNEQTVNISGTWYPSNTYSQTLTRNEEGNVTLMERAVWYKGEFDPIYRIHIKYGEDGKACEITTEELTNVGTGLEWKAGNSYEDIVWHSFDGQIVSVESLFEGANRIESANAVINGQSYRIVAEYGDDGSWCSRAIQFDPDVELDLEERIEYTPVDEYGSCRIVNTIGYVEDDNIIGGETLTMNYNYDPDGLILLEETVYNDGETESTVEKIEGVVEYDPEYGYPLQWTVAELNVDTGEMENSFRAEFSDYVGLVQSGIGEVSADAPSGYYNLMGLPVATPQKGMMLIEKDRRGVRKIIF